jgi:hypothetical protein
MTTLFLICAVAALIFGLGWLASMWARAAGRSEAQSAIAKQDVELVKKQGDVLAEKRTVEDAARRLDDGNF